MTMFNIKKIFFFLISCICLIFILYIFPSFNAIFDSRIGFIYHPKTERIYKLKLSFFPSMYDFWEPFLFNEPVYNEPVGGRYLGKLPNVLNEIAADKKLLEKNSSAWREKLMNKTENFLNKLKNNKLQLYDFQYYIKKENITQKELENLTKIINFDSYNFSNFKIVDVVINKWTRILNADIDSEILESSKVFKNALLIRGNAAYDLADILEITI